MRRTATGLRAAARTVAPALVVRVIMLVFVPGLAGCAASGSEVDPHRTGSSVERSSPVRAAELNTRLGVGYLERGDLQVAMQKLELALRQDPKHVPAHMALGIVYDTIGREGKALEHLETAVRLAPEDGAAQNTYAALLCRTGRFAEADRHFRAALEDPFYGTPDVALANAGSCARRAGELDKAERYLRRAIEIAPENRTALYNLALVSFDQGEPLAARAFLQRLAAGGPLSPTALLLGVRVERALGSEADAQEYARLLTKRFPDSPQASELRQQNENDD
ncbi:MAG: type IV pilus biogenesis/stability protein PilW [Wenzhouxiangellaceae bacterium]|nr:type IV pilus biogenesis/stability protein PilW [Wenzhouxiangellaceae bacterium]